MSTCNLAFIVPCYNEEANIPLFCQRVNEVFIDTKIDFEVIFIDDGSTDHTLETLRRIIEVDPQLNFTVLSFSRNFGKEAAILAGLKECCKEKCEYVCIIDADLQQDPQYALQMLDILKSNKGYDCVAAYQETRKEGYVLSKFKNIFYWIINKISDVEFINGASDFRLFHRCVAEAILELPEYQRFTKGIFFLGWL